MTLRAFEKLQEMDRLLLEQFLLLLNQSGENLTHQELLVARDFLKLNHHSEIEKSLEHLQSRHPEFTISQIQRILDILLKFKIISRTRLENQDYLEHNHAESRHFHMVCLKTGKVKEFHSEVLEELVHELALKEGFYPVMLELNVYGLDGDYYKTSQTFSLSRAIREQWVEIVSLDGLEPAFLEIAKSSGLGLGSWLKVLDQTIEGDFLVQMQMLRLVIKHSQARIIQIKALEPEKIAIAQARIKSTPHKNLQDLAVGQSARVLRIRNESSHYRRLLDLGFVTGSLVRKERLAPLLDPAEYTIRGYHVSLRNDEARDVLVEIA